MIFCILIFFTFNLQTTIKLIFMHDPLLAIPWDWLSCLLIKKQNTFLKGCELGTSDACMNLTFVV